MATIISVEQLSKTYGNGFVALDHVDLTIEAGEIFALLGPNGAGKTTLISTVCGIINPSSGKVLVGGFDIVKQYRDTRSLIGLVPQELTTDAFESVWNTVNFSRGLFGKSANPDHIEKILKDLSLWDKKDNMLRELSGGMKRRVMIAKALSHEPKILFLDEPTAGVDVELRKDMWDMVHRLRESGVTIILTTHYIEEAEEIADRVGVINGGKIILVEEKSDLMRKLGKKHLIVDLKEPLNQMPDLFSNDGVEYRSDSQQLIYSFDSHDDSASISTFLDKLAELKIQYKDLQTEQSSLEDIFIGLLKEPK